MIRSPVLRSGWLIARREIMDTLRDWRQVVPMLLLTFVLPLLSDFGAKKALDFVAEYGGEVMGERFIPFLLLMVGFFPVSASLYTALGVFAGEKERKSLEPLLATPLADWQLYLGKFVGTVIPPLLAAYLGMAIYSIGLVIMADWVVPVNLLVLVMVLATVQAAVMVAIAVVVSSQTTSVRAAGLLASFIVIPIGGLIMAESFVIISSTPEWLWGFVVALILVAALFIRMGIHLFDREELLVRDIDQLNFSKGWQIFRERLRSKSSGRFGWFRFTFSRLAAWRLPAVLMVGVWGASMLLGYYLAGRFAFPAQMLRNLPEVMSENIDLIQRDPFLAGGLSSIILFHNLRALLIQAVLGVLSFGVVAVIVFMLPWGLIGYLAGQFALAGTSPFAIVPFLIPHAILELPALLLAATAMLHWGATTVAPPPGRGLFSVWLEAAADLVRVLVSLVFPLLLAAAILETYVTPALVSWIYG